MKFWWMFSRGSLLAGVYFARLETDKLRDNLNRNWLQVALTVFQVHQNFMEDGSEHIQHQKKD
ncbi:hypothetical protein [Companilactobacillus mindensis]|uniref:hypothetical protein n=1 Tax=Companilactobacillus mindensis TaxID=167481 RepID=UPI000A755529|nr:hypothetical protein [Companilactobacillus mindensis]